MTLKESPRKLFLIDGMGAILSAFLLGVVLVKLERVFGIPSSTLYILASFPILFAIYDYYCYRMVDNNLSKFIKGIAAFNLFYYCLSIGFALHHYQEITYFGWSYMILEIIIVFTLAIVELRVAITLPGKRSDNP